MKNIKTITHKNPINMKYSNLIIAFFIAITYSCSQEDTVHYTPEDKLESTDPIDVYIKQKLTDTYNARVVWDWQQPLYVKNFNYRLLPPQREVIIPTVDMILTYFVEPIKNAANGEALLKNLFPPEFVFAGSAAYESDGKAYAGVAESGVNIMLTSLNNYNPGNKTFIINKVHTIHHEFTHIVNQNTTEGVPEAYTTVNTAYTGGNWVNYSDNNRNDFNHIRGLGYVSAYGSQNPAEDFAEMVSTYLTRSDEDFNATYITHGSDEELNTGKDYIAKKLQIAKDYYQSNYNINLEEIKANVQAELDKL